MSTSPHFQKLLDDVKKFGWHVIMVPADDEGPSFGYTVGVFKSFGHAELVMVGLKVEALHAFLNLIVGEVKAGKRFEVGPRYPEIIEGYECCFRSVHLSQFDEYFGQAIRFYGDKNFPVLQCVYPDKAGRFPWEDGCSPGFVAMQTMLDGERRGG